MSQNITDSNFDTLSKNENSNKKTTEKTHKKTGRKNTSRSKKNKLINAIKNLDIQTVITPKKVNFENDVTTYRKLIKELAKEVDYIEEYTEDNKTRYRKVAEVCEWCLKNFTN